MRLGLFVPLLLQTCSSSPVQTPDEIIKPQAGQGPAVPSKVALKNQHPFHSTVTATRKGAQVVIVETKSRLVMGISGAGLSQERT